MWHQISCHLGLAFMTGKRTDWGGGRREPRLPRTGLTPSLLPPQSWASGGTQKRAAEDKGVEDVSSRKTKPEPHPAWPQQRILPSLGVCTGLRIWGAAAWASPSTFSAPAAYHILLSCGIKKKKTTGNSILSGFWKSEQDSGPDEAVSWDLETWAPVLRCNTGGL